MQWRDMLKEQKYPSKHMKVAPFVSLPYLADHYNVRQNRTVAINGIPDSRLRYCRTSEEAMPEKITIERIRNCYANAKCGGYPRISNAQYVEHIGRLLEEIDSRPSVRASASAEAEAGCRSDLSGRS